MFSILIMVCGLLKLNTDCCLDAEKVVLLNLINQQLQWCAQASQVVGDHFLNVLQPRVLKRSHTLQIYPFLDVVVISLTGQNITSKDILNKQCLTGFFGTRADYWMMEKHLHPGTH